MQRNKILIILIVIVLGAFGFYFFSNNKTARKTVENLTDLPDLQDEGGVLTEELDPLAIATLRAGEYPGSEITIEQTLDDGSNHERYITSYRSEGLKIYALLTIPKGDQPEGGWPAIVFNHGFIPPAEYRTTERYIAYVDGFARNGYIVFRPDYRGHGNSEGEPEGAYGSNAYTIDVLNAFSSLQKYKDVNPQKVGMWGHSLGGFITLRAMVVNPDVKAGVIWAGVVGSYPDLLNRWRRGTPRPTLPGARPSWRLTLTEKYGTPEENPDFWNSISANFFLKDISGPVQLHHGTADGSVPVEFSEKLDNQLKDAGKTGEIYTYPGDDHNIAQNFSTAMQRSIEFFDKYLKGE